MPESAARIIEQPTETSRKLWDTDDQVANRLNEIQVLCNRIKERIEWGDLFGATRAVLATKRLAKDASKTLAQRGRRR